MNTELKNNTEASQHGNGVALSRNLGLFSITMIGVGGMIGAGIFVLTGTAAGVAGPGLILAFILNGIVATMTAMAYAELGSAFPEAGGGYLWVKEGLGGTNGFLAGWMSWFAHVVVGSLYALAFGRFAAELWHMTAMPMFGLQIHTLSLILTAVIIAAFTFINYKGVSETSAVGNIITMTKIVILAFFVLFGVLAMLRRDQWHTAFSNDFLPFGALGVFTAMGITFVAFEGYEIIAQSGEEAINPKRNLPRATFLAIGIAVLIYVLVAVAAIGSVIPTEGLTAYEYLDKYKETAIVEVAAQTFPFGLGRIVLLLSGLISTISALNATTFSSSRVSFAMGRDHNLPGIFAEIHPERLTPHWAVIISGSMMFLFAVSLPIEDVAAAASIMFLLLFLQVNIAVMTLRKKMPDLDRGFRIPWFPVIPVIAIFLNGVLAVHLFSFSAIAWYTAIIWIVIGLLAYLAHFSKVEAMEKPKEILMEEVLVSRQYSVTVPVSTQEEGRILGNIGAILAEAKLGEVLALHIIRVPPQLTLSEGRIFLKEGRPTLETVIQEAKTLDVPVHTIIRLGRNVSDAIRKTVIENASDLLLLGWPGYTSSTNTLFGSVIDPLLDNPPCDVAMVRYRKRRPLRSILVPVAGGINSRLAVRLATQMGNSAEDGPANITLMQVLREGASQSDKVRAEQILQRASEGFDYDSFSWCIRESNDVVEAILEESEGSEEFAPFDLIVIGASQEPLFRNLLTGNVAVQISEKASMTVMIAKRRSSALHSFLRETVLPSSAERLAEQKQI